MFFLRFIFSVFYLIPAVFAQDPVVKINAPVYFGSYDFDAFSVWSSLARGYPSKLKGEVVAPYSYQWDGADGGIYNVSIDQPRVGDRSKYILISPPVFDQDASPIFENALVTARDRGIRVIRLKPGIYHFKSIKRNRNSHIVIENIDDLLVDGAGAKLVFHTPAHGVYIWQSKRIEFRGVEFSYAYRTSSFGRVESSDIGNVIRINSNFPVDNKTALAQVVERSTSGVGYLAGGGRVLFGPKSLVSYQHKGAQIFFSKEFSRFPIGSEVAIIHYWYGPTIFRIEGERTEFQTEDIVLNKVKFSSGPGMAVAVKGLKRGLAIVDCVFSPSVDGANPVGISWDAIHIHSGGGDILIKGNYFSGMLDDAINISNLIHPVTLIDSNAASISVSNNPSFIDANDRLAFFSGEGRLIGIRTVLNVSRGFRKSEDLFFLDGVPWKEAEFVRNLNNVARGFAIVDNVIEHISGHAILAQIPNGIVVNNRVSNITRNAIRLLTDVGNWNEGVGAFNVAVRNNSFSNTGFDPVGGFSWGVVSAYASLKRGVKAVPVNDFVDVSNNIITGYKNECVSISDTARFKVEGNICSQ